jgi:TolA-binding protein
MSDLSSLQELGKRVAATQDEWLERAVPLDSARDDFLLRMGAARRARRGLLLVVVAAALGVLAGIAAIVGPRIWISSHTVQALVNSRAAPQNSWIRSEASERLPIDFSDGSRITLEPGSRVRIAELRPNGATLAVETGGLDVSVKHHGQTDYRLSLGPFLVRVTGTRFNVSFSPEQDLLRVSMREGSVVVSGCALGDPRPLRAGDSLTASCRNPHFEISRGQIDRAPAGSAVAVIESADSAPVAPNVPSDDAVRSNPRPARAEGELSWQALARAGKYGKALGSVDVLGFAAECERASDEELALLADVARFGRRPQQAILALSTLRRRYSSSSLASVAAFNMARVHFDQRGAYDDAARWFRVYLKEQPSGPLAREAQGRLMEALYRGGDRAGAVRAADSYLTANPSGPHARLARTLLGR